MKKIPFTIAMSSIPILLGAIPAVFGYFEERKRDQAELKARVDACAHKYANATVFKMYQENRIKGPDHMRDEWNFAYMTHLLEKH